MLNAGANQTLSVIFTPTDATDYASVTSSVSITVSRATVNYTIGSASQTYGSPVNLATALGTTIPTGINGQTLNIAYSSSSGDTATANVGSYPITGTVLQRQRLVIQLHSHVD